MFSVGYTGICNNSCLLFLLPIVFEPHSVKMCLTNADDTENFYSHLFLFCKQFLVLCVCNFLLSALILFSFCVNFVVIHNMVNRK